MRIGMVVPSLGFAGGIERHAHDLAEALALRGHELTLFHGPARGRDPDAYARPFAKVWSLSSAPPPPCTRDLDVVYVHKAVDASELDPLGRVPIAVATHDHDLTCVRRHRYLPLGEAPCHRAPGIACVIHGCCVVRERSGGPPLRVASPFRLRSRLRLLAKRAPLVACSRYVADNVVAAGVAPARVRVVHPVPPEDDAPTRPRPKARRLFAAGQLLRGKGFDLAIDALAHLPSDVTLEIAGDGPLRERLGARARRVAGRVALLGYVAPEDLRQRYDAASVIVVPSRWPEPFGMVGIEAMRRARPVAGAAHGGIPEWLEEGRAGRLFDPGSPESLARAVLALLEDEDAGERAHDFAAERFPHARAVDAFEAMLSDIAREGPP